MTRHQQPPARRRDAESSTIRPSRARGARTALQGGAGYVVAELIDTFLALSDSQLALLAVILTALFSWVQTTVEDYIGKALLREVPEADQPVADAAPQGEGGAVSWVTVAAAAVIVACVVIVMAYTDVRIR